MCNWAQSMLYYLFTFHVSNNFCSVHSSLAYFKKAYFLIKTTVSIPAHRSKCAKKKMNTKNKIYFEILHRKLLGGSTAGPPREEKQPLEHFPPHCALPPCATSKRPYVIRPNSFIHSLFHVVSVILLSFGVLA